MRSTAAAVLLAAAYLGMLAQADTSDEVPLRHDWKLTFKKPYVINSTIPHFDHIGNTLPSIDFIRVSPSVQGMRGAVWSNIPNPHKEWRVDMAVNVFGRHIHGGDGMAFWYTKERATFGPVYGSQDKWNGLMVAMDSYDKKDTRTNPFVQGVLNHGDLELDKAEHPKAHILSGCFRDFRNTIHPTHLRIQYANRTLTVDVDNEASGKRFQSCFQSTDIDLPTGYYFGVSAGASHSEADDHDIISFDVFEIKQHAEKVEHAKEMTNEQREHLEATDKKVEAAQQAKVPQTGFNIEDLRKLEDTQFRLLNKLDLLLQKSDSSMLNSGRDSANHGTGADMSTLAADVRALQDSVHALTNDISHFLGNNGIVRHMEELQHAIEKLNDRIHQLDDRSTQLHAETRTSIHQATSERSTSVAWYLVYAVVVQMVVYFGWNLYQQQAKRERRKYI